MTTFIESTARYGYDFICGEFLPEGKDEFYIRDRQLEELYAEKKLTSLGNTVSSAGSGFPHLSVYRHLKESEIQILKQNRNSCTTWNDVFVTDNFDPELLKDNFFAGRIRIGRMAGGLLRYHDYIVPVGISYSRIISCDIGDSCAIHNCSYISHYIIGDGVILSCIDEMDTTNHSKFGEGIIKDGEEEKVRVFITPLNESGGRGVLPFNDMICADAYLWTTKRGDTELMDAFMRITNDGVDTRRGYYGVIGYSAVIKHCNTIKDVIVGDCAYIKGANKLKNLTIKSCIKEPTQIGEGVELVNGIVGFGCHVFYGCKAVRFVIGNNCNLKYGARLINSILGDNSTVSCCEVLNNLVFPAHEQHHNNSFLIAAMLMGQSNLAAGATVGSNHNSRGNDGEIIAGRGFWPGLSSAIKHNSRFASYTLIAKGNYPVELDIPLPFCLLTNNRENSRRVVMPAYWWMYNMFALERNSWKYKSRDDRTVITQRYETDYLAPDTVREIINALSLLDTWASQTDNYDRVLVPGRTLERSEQAVRIVKVHAGSAAYRQMLCYYAVKTLTNYLNTNKTAFNVFQSENKDSVSFEWENLGGQLVPKAKVEALCDAIRNGTLKSWKDIHGEYERLYAEYPHDKARNALQVLRFLNGSYDTPISNDKWNEFLDEALRIRSYIEDQVYKTKLKDYSDPFRNITYSNDEERDVVLGRLDKNQFVLAAREESRLFAASVQACRR